jgi:multiple sugar transport system substrate-binding protein
MRSWKALSRVALAVMIAVIVVAAAGAAALLLTRTPGTAPATTVPTPSAVSTPATPPGQGSQPGVSGKITVLAASGDPTLAPFLNMVAQDFQARYSGARVEVQLVPFGQLVTTALTALKNQNPVPDVIIFYPSQAPTLSPYLLDLSPYIGRVFNSSDLPPAAMLPVYLLAPNGSITKVSGVPMQQVFGYVFVYRKSIFYNQSLASEFKNSTGYNLDPRIWKSWEEVVAAAKFIQSKGLTKYALLFPNGLQLSIFNGFIGLFYSYALDDPYVGIPQGAPGGYWTYFKDVGGKVVPTINSTAGVKALEMYKQLIQFQPPISVQAMEYDQLRDLFLTGDYAMVAAWTSFIPLYNNASISRVAGDIDIAPLPRGGSGIAPTFAGINPYGNVDLALKFVNFMLSPEEGGKGARLYGFVPGTFSALQEASKAPGMEWLGPFIDQLKQQRVVDLKRQALVNQLSAFFTDLRPIFIQEVYKYFQGQQSAEQALNNIASQWSQIIASRLQTG